jgi:hypothetical protein
MAALATGQTQANQFATAGYSPTVSAGVRQALALVGGAVETNQTIRREAKFVERRAPVPFSGDKVDIGAAAADPAGKPAPEKPKADDNHLRKLSLTGQPAAEQADNSRGNLVDIET